jgi:undecaprenyl-diphosphatase
LEWTKTKGILLLVIIIGIFLGLLLILGNGNPIAGDSTLFFLLNPHTPTPYDEFFIFFSNWGPGDFGIGIYFMIAFTIVLLVLSLKFISLRPMRLMLLLVVGGFIIGYLGITIVLKDIIERTRPFADGALLSNAWNLFSDPVTLFNDPSFPSGHATAGFIFATPFLLLFKKNWIRALALAYGILVAYARIFIGVHYPLDVFVGSLIGILVVAGLYLLFKRYLLPKLPWFQLEEATPEKKP